MFELRKTSWPLRRTGSWLPAVRAAALILAIGPAGCATAPGGFFGHWWMSSHECLARVMYFESNRSSDDGMLAVGTVVMNRVHSSQFPNTVCAVVGQPRQFAPGALDRPTNGRGWARAQRIASAVLAGARHPGVGRAMYFHTAGYTFPYHNMHYVLVAGGNAFYEKTTGGQRYSPVASYAEQRRLADAERLSVFLRTGRGL